MCGRFTLKTSEKELQDELGLALDVSTTELVPRYNVAPTQPVAVVVNGSSRKLELFRWGLIPWWANDPKIGNKMINARAEGLLDKPSFRVPLAKRRCIVLADGFYEWRTEGRMKTPFYIQLSSGRPFAMAGLWETWVDANGNLVPSCTIITTRPNAFMARHHDRMPVILPRERIEQWLAPEECAPESLLPLLAPWAGEDLRSHPVSGLVNKPDNEMPECIVPVPEQPTLFQL
jgi:putative SOS response-associated peptidase YedK